MSLFGNLLNTYKSATPKQLVLSGAFMLALAGAIGGGFASRVMSTAATLRDCDLNSINRVAMNGGCGAADPAELIADVKANNPNDLQGIYAHFGLTSSQYNDFAANAKQGTFFRDGHIEVDGQTVATNGHSMGRHNFGGSSAYVISGVGTYYEGTPNQRWASGTSSIPVMVWFDGDGTVITGIMNPCGNPVPKMDRVRSGGECKQLVKTPVEGKKNTYKFTTDASVFGLAKIVKYEYFVNDGSGDKLVATKTSGSDAVEITFEKASTVTVKVTISLPGGKSKTITSELCKKEVGVVKEEFLYKCDALIATARDNTNRKFRFTVMTKQSDNVTVDSADFTLDDSLTTKGVTNKDSDGNFFKDYDFNDTKTHVVSVIVNFTADGKLVTSKEGDCVARVTPEKTPVCEFNPNLPPNHPDCKKPECVEKPGSGFPPGDERCKECVPEGKGDQKCELVKTGPVGVAGLFTGVTAFGAVAHRLFMNRRSRSE